MKKLFFYLLLLASPLCALTQEEHPYKISPTLDQSIKDGLHELYNFNFDKSLEIFKTVEADEKDHPMIAFGVASVYWWRGSTMVLESDENATKLFMEAVNHCIDLSEDKIKNGDPTGEAHLALGGALGLLGRWQAANHEWMGAYFKGKKAYKYLVKALSINPQLLDANMGKGIFDYYIATLPTMVRVLGFVGMGGDPSVGIAELQEAGEKGIYARTPSKLFLADIYSNPANMPEKSFALLEAVRKEYPRSSFIHMMHLIALYNAGRVDELKKEALLFNENITNGVYEKEAITQGHFAMGIAHFKAKGWNEAADEFSKASLSENLNDPWRTWAKLYLGYVYDVQEKRIDAKKQYHAVLNELRRWGSHDLAKAHLKEPFKGTDEELKKLSL